MNKRFNSKLLLASIIFLGALGLGTSSVLASGISMGGIDQSREFGQGSFVIKVCDNWVRLDLVPGATGTYGAPAGFSPLVGITIDGLDTGNCKSTKFTMGARSSTGSTLPLYRTDKEKQLCVTKACVIGKSAEGDFDLLISAQQIASLTTADKYHTLALNTSTGVFTINFTQPTILATDVSNLTIQSASI